MKPLTKLCVLTSLCWVLLAAVTTVQATELPILTGEHWTESTEAQKKAFLFGMATMLEAEQEAQGDNPGKEVVENSLVPTLVKGLDPYTIMTAMEAIDSYYGQNSDKLKRPVIEVIWFELALPNVTAK
ncbi:MAG: hypothetical protein V2J55_13625 [Candidatus Competibacteraceae bacterium]|jgi:hypothetical protein|nr:hypothetical protein [Candidatus Competibacteraceae bacterium]